MTPEDTQEFFDSWDLIYLAFDKTLRPEVKEMYFKLLVGYSIEQIKAGLQSHMADPERGRFPPKPADVISKIQILSPSGYLGAEQAWAQFPRDESQSACICNEMAKAWGIACELDSISGRMAFKEAYEREVATSKAKGGVPSWYISTGSDKQQLQQTALDAVRDKLISPRAAMVYLPHIEESDLVKLSTDQVTVNYLIENHAQTVTSMDQLLLESAPVADVEVAKSHLAGLRELLGAS